MSEQENNQTGFTTLFGADEPQTEPAAPAEPETDERYANVRAHVELGIRIYGNRAVFGQAIGTTSGTVGNWLNGKMPRGSMLIKIAAALGVGPDALFHEPLPDLIARAESSTAPKRTRKRREQSAGEDAASEEHPEPAADVEPQQPAEPADSEAPSDEEVQPGGEALAEEPSSVPAAPAAETAQELPAEAPADVEPQQGGTDESLNVDAQQDPVADALPVADIEPKPDAALSAVEAPELRASADEVPDPKPIREEETEDKDDLPPPVFAPFPGVQDALSAFGERLSRYLEEQGIRPGAGALFDGQIPEQKIRCFILGTAVPDLIDLRLFAVVFDVSVNTLRCEVFLPSKALRELDAFEPAAAACGLGPMPQEPELVEVQQEEPVDEPSGVEPPHSEPTPQQEERPAPACARIALGDFCYGAKEPVSQLVSCEFETGVLAEMAKKRELCLYTVPSNELEPHFAAGDTVVVDVTHFKGEGEQDCWDLGSPGWYLVGTYSAAQLRHLSFCEGQIISTGAADDGESFDTIRVLGAVVARISVSAV